MNIAISLNDFDDSESISSGDIFMAAGFRVKKSNVMGDIARSKRECYPSAEINKSYYLDLKIDSKAQIALAYDDQLLVDGKWQQSPSPRGFSGGAIMKAAGITLFQPVKSRQECRQTLTAITTEYRKKTGKTPGVLIGTRIGVHLGLIQKFLPGLLD